MKTAKDFGYPFENDGVLIGRRPEDYVAGTASALSFEERNPSGDWLAQAKQLGDEKQWSVRGDSMSCVSFAALNCEEIQELFTYGSFVDKNDRFTAIDSGTTPQGNYLYKVGDSMRKTGVAKESIWPFPESFTTQEWLAPIPNPPKDELYADARNYLLNREIRYEWVHKNDWEKHLKHAPFVGIIPGHAVCIVKVGGGVVTYLDTYAPYIKTLPISSFDDWAMKLVLTFKDSMKLINDNGTVFIVGEKGKIGLADEPLFNALKEITNVETGSTSGIPQVKVIESLQGFLVKDK